MLRIMLFLATNLAILLVVSAVVKITGVDRYFGTGLDGLLIMAALFGMGGAFVSLLLSKWIAKRSTGAQVITQPRTPGEAWLLSTVQRQAQAAGIGVPEVAIYDAPEPNAFATGANKNAALVAVSTGLLKNMKQEEVEAVLGHEISHVANGDMITLTLIQGVLNTFVIFLARIVGGVIDSALRPQSDNGGGHHYGFGYMMTVMVLEVLFGVLASIVVAWFSRFREFRADAGGAHLAGRQNMVAALRRLSQAYGQTTMPKAMTAFGINGGIRSLFATHPPIELRIARLQQGA